MKKLLLLSLISMAMFIPQIYSRSIRDLIKQEGMPQVVRSILNLSNKNLTNLEGLQNIPNINKTRELYLYNNQLQKLPVGIFNGLKKLERLSLDNNQLQTLPVGIFNGLNNLWELNLSKNQLQTLPADIFNGLNNLWELYLNRNQLQTLPADIFNGLNNLERLSLKDNPFNTEFLLTLPRMIHNIPKLDVLDNHSINTALESYRVYQPKSLLETSAEKVTKTFTPEQLERLAKTNYTAFELLPLSQAQKTAILKQVATQLAATGDPAFDLLPLSQEDKKAILDQVAFNQPVQPVAVGHGLSTLKELTSKYITQDLTLKELNQIAETNPTVLNVLPLSESVKKAILDRIAKKGSV